MNNKEYRLPNMGGPTISTRLARRLIVELGEGVFADAKRLPSEVEMAERFGVSRSVIRDVLAELEREGYVERGRGVGTIINREIVRLDNRLDLKFEYFDLIRAAGAQPSVDHVKLYQLPADEGLAEKLSLDVGAPLIVCEKRILAGGVPVIYSVDHLPEMMFAYTDWRKLDWAVPVFDLLEEQSGIAVNTNITRIKAVQGPAPVRQMLQAGEDEALIMLDEIGYYKLSRPIIHSYGFYTNYFEFTMLRKKF